VTPAEYLPWIALVTQLVIVAMAAAKAREKLDAAEKRILAQEQSFEKRLTAMDGVWGSRCNKLDAAFERRIGELNARQASFDTFAEATLRDRATLISEVAALKQDAAHAEAQREAFGALIQKVCEEIAGISATVQEQYRGLEKGMEHLTRGLDGANRQLANIAANGLGFSNGSRARRGKTTE
jgi:chromosome segregation ATPase